MDRSMLARKRKQDAPPPLLHTLPPTPPSVRNTRSPQRAERATFRRPNVGKIRDAKDSYETARVPRRFEPVVRPDTGASGSARSGAAQGDVDARQFTVANVGAGGRLYLEPYWGPPQGKVRIAPATPPHTAGGTGRVQISRPSARQSQASGTWTPRVQGSKGGTLDPGTTTKPPLSLANASAKRRSRSHSFSNIGERVHPSNVTLNNSQLNGGNAAPPRPKSSIDLTGGFLDLQIPHYRLGTPRFSDRGTAYLHNSVYTLGASENMSSSRFSRAEHDRLSPAPSGHPRGTSLTPARRTVSPHLQPDAARTSGSPGPRKASIPKATTPVVQQSGGSMSSIYDQVEANPDNPSMVRYHGTTGKIVAATPARLIAQITSPMFLDYELLSDFFLTFRSFMSCGELLEYLMARMEWALGTTTDAGRIVRVRTFVALRHWILNYFADDFVLGLALRQRFCDLVNDLAKALHKRPGNGGSDMNIVGEMKKCWRRTCAMFWPVADALDTSPEADIVPGGDQSGDDVLTALTTRQHALQHKVSKADFRRVSRQLQVPAERQPERPREPKSVLMRQASIPTSPMSVESLQVLSCSIPFLRYIRPIEKTAHKFGVARPVGPQRNPPLSGKMGKPPMHQHKRSGSFSDALRDGRGPQPSTVDQSGDTTSPAAMVFTGGLVRGLLLQPSPAQVELLVPISPAGDPRAVRFGGIDDEYFDDKSGQNLGVKRLVGDVKRALSSRKGRHESPTSSHQSDNSSDSRSSMNMAPIEQTKSGNASAWQHLRGAAREDVLGARASESYKKAFHDADLPDPADEEAHLELQRQREVEIPPNPPESNHQESDHQQQRESGVAHQLDRDLSLPRLDRWNSHVTTGDRSILIMDDTGSFDAPPMMSRALPSVSSVSSSVAPEALFRKPDATSRDFQHIKFKPNRRSTQRSVSFSGEHVLSAEFFEVSPPAALPSMTAWGSEPSTAGETLSPTTLSPTTLDFTSMSSGTNPTATEMPAPHQLRRRPGGDLKAADHVHELGPLARRHSAESLSTLSLSQPTSAVHSGEMSSAQLAGQSSAYWRAPPRVASDPKRKSVGLLDWESGQPNLRPSFQAEVSQLARLSDRSPVGGIEDTLLKLEGKARTPTDDSFAGAADKETQEPAARLIDAKHRTVDEGQVLSPTRTETQGASIYHMSDSEGVTDESRFHSMRQSELHGHSEAQGPLTPVLPSSAKAMSFPVDERHSPATPKIPMTFERTESPLRNVPGDLSNRAISRGKSSTQGSFLLDDNESLSDISTEMADSVEDESPLGVRSFYFDDTADDDDVPQAFTVPHAFTSPPHSPPTPPSTGGAPPKDPIEQHVERVKAMPTHLKSELKESHSAPRLMSPRLEVPDGSAELRRVNTAPSPQLAAHLPFLVAFESDVIAEQLTIIEKDAIDEVDWKDLINMNWQQSPPQVRNWVEFLKTSNCTGIDIVVARFNLVVKWVVSECLLTEMPSERAKCITKFVHIAMHCRRFRNYASMYQITLGLLSADLARLHATWTLVGPAEKQNLENLDKLCQPLRNFANLRQEMEGSSLDSGCIPFIGLYTHDLMYNAQKPARIELVPAGGEPLINFERYQTTATIVKSLLRLIEASSKYVFHPHPEVLSRCLWLAALEDSEITSRSKTLEH